MAMRRALWLFLSCTSCAARSLPDGPIIAAWSSWHHCNASQTLTAAARGVNVIFWFAGNLLTKDGAPYISAADLACVRLVQQRLQELGLETTHLMTIGGWNAPHPSDAFTGRQWFEAWHVWQQAHGEPFDGFDWDLEGNDIVPSIRNVFSPAMMQLVVDMSVAAKEAGYLVTMAPAQTYFDVTMGAFNRYLNNSNKEFYDFHPDFEYRGRNAYAYWWQRAPPGTFDLISLQLYESYSPAMRALASGENPAEYARELARSFLQGWTIDFNDPELPLQGRVHVQPKNLMLGVSWLAPPKCAFIWPADLRKAYEAAAPAERPRGYSFWDIGLEDTPAPRQPNATRNLSMATELNEFLRVRDPDLFRV